MKALFTRFVMPEVQRKLGQLYRKAVRMKLEGIVESALAPLIKRELGLYPGTYIKSHPRGISEGRSRIELDVVSVKRSKRRAEKVGAAVAADLARAIRRAGGEITSSRGADVGGV